MNIPHTFSPIQTPAEVHSPPVGKAATGILDKKLLALVPTLESNSFKSLRERFQNNPKSPQINKSYDPASSGVEEGSVPKIRKNFEPKQSQLASKAKNDHNNISNFYLKKHNQIPRAPGDNLNRNKSGSVSSQDSDTQLADLFEDKKGIPGAFEDDDPKNINPSLLNTDSDISNFYPNKDDDLPNETEETNTEETVLSLTEDRMLFDDDIDIDSEDSETQSTKSHEESDNISSASQHPRATLPYLEELKELEEDRINKSYWREVPDSSNS